MYDIIYITNLPSFYKINLLNRINQKAKIFVIFTGDTALMRNSDFFVGDIQFNYISLAGLSNIHKLIKTFSIVKGNKYNELIICGINELTSWLCAFISPKTKNATVVESSYHEATTTGLKGYLKTIFFKRISKTYASGKSQVKYAQLHHFKGQCIITKGVGIFNIVDQPPFIPSEKITNFIYVGRLSPEKNLIFLIETFNMLPKYKLHIVGYGLQENELKKIAKDNIIFLGAVENSKLPALYKSCDVFILPSISEPWGLVVEEALNNGLPVIVSNKVGCAEEIIEENHNGLIFEYNSKNSLISKIEKMVDIDYYNSLKYNISKTNFNETADYQANCYLKNKMPTLFQINVSANWGSTGKIAEQIGEVAISNGWKSYIAYSRYANSSKSELIKIGSKLDVFLHVLEARLFDRAGLGARRATKILIKKIEEIKPDVIQLHNIHGYVVNYKLLFEYLNKTNIQVVWTFHDCWAFTGHCAYFDRVICNKWKTQCYKCPQTKKYPASFVFDHSKTNFLFKKELFTSIDNLTLVTVSHWLSDLLKDSFLNKYQKITIHNGLDTDVFKPIETSEIRKRYKLKNKFILLGVASIWSERKGLNDFIELSRLLDNSSLIILIGLNSNQLKNLPPNIIGIKRTENVQQLAEFYSVADVFLNTTYEDNFPTTNIEALACGTPVITYKTGGSPEAIDKKTGIVVDQGDIKSLVWAIEHIRANGKLFYSENCRKRVEEFFNKDDRFQNYIELYEELLKNKK